MSQKLASTILILRVAQLLFSLVFLVFWTWACAAHYVVRGGPGEYFFGFFTALVSLGICAHGFWAFRAKQHQVEHTQLYHHARWALDLALVVFWLGVILISILVPMAPEDHKNALNEGTGDSGTAIAGLGANIGMLFSAITFFMTALLLIITVARVGKTTTPAPAEAVEDGLQA